MNYKYTGIYYDFSPVRIIELKEYCKFNNVQVEFKKSAEVIILKSATYEDMLSVVESIYIPFGMIEQIKRI